jgi:DNA-binding MarR family transcriptional regulator
MSWCTGGDELDQDIFDAMTDLITLLLRRAERLAGQYGVPMFCVKAIHRLDRSVTLKELGKRMHCDPSFVTMIADALEERGLARREPNPADRRIKNLVLTDQGLELKGTIERALLSDMPWSRALDSGERESLLALLRKMKQTLADPSSGPRGQQEGGTQHGEVIAATETASPAAS